VANGVEVTNLDPSECILIGSLLVKCFYPFPVHSNGFVLGIANGCRGYSNVSPSRCVDLDSCLYPLPRI
jgi:hypothetical protein